MGSHRGARRAVQKGMRDAVQTGCFSNPGEAGCSSRWPRQYERRAGGSVARAARDDATERLTVRGNRRHRPECRR